MPSSSSDETPRADFTLAWRAPFDWDFLLDFYRARAVAGVEEVAGRTYRRVLRNGTHVGVVAVRPTRGARLAVTCRGLPASTHATLAERLRRAFDLDTDMRPIQAALARDPRLAPLIAARPGLRIPAMPDPFEQGVRAILGQQISVAAARELAARLCARWGSPLAPALGEGLTHAFPSPAALATADVASLGMPRARGRAVAGFAAAVLAQPELLTAMPDHPTARARLLALPGIGPWSAHYIAMRALRDPDAFPASDIGLLRALADAAGQRPSVREAAALAAAWQPWRSYAAQYLWSRDPGPTAPRRRA